jgi:hypothetical protein
MCHDNVTMPSTTAVHITSGRRTATVLELSPIQPSTPCAGGHQRASGTDQKQQLAPPAIPLGTVSNPAKRGIT